MPVYASLPKNVWIQRSLYMLQTFATPFAYYFRPLCVALALSWLVYRASQVLHKPLHELSSLLGFEIPTTPNIDLAGIKSDGAIIHWTLPEKPRQKKELKYTVHLNGVLIGSVSAYESAVTIVGLQPSKYYIVRVGLVNSHEFSSRSAPIRFCTKPAASGDHFVATHDGHDTDADHLQDAIPRVKPYRGLKDIAPASPVSAPMTREGSGGLAPRRVSGRRPSPANLGLADKHDPQPEDSEAPEGAETIQQLTEKLDAIRRETEEAERQAKEEEEEEARQREELIKERDELKAEVNKREKASRDLKREVNTLERQNTAAQNERAKQERLLQQKVQDRQKLKDDMARWERETETMLAEAEDLRRQKEECLRKGEQEKEQLRARLAEETAKVKELDDDVKDKTSEIKKLERALKNSSPDASAPEPNMVQQMQIDAEDERQWQAHKQNLQMQYATAFSKVEAARRFHAEQMRYLESLRAERRRQEEAVQYASPPPTQERAPRRGDSQRSRHATGRHSITDSPRLAAFPPVSQSPFMSDIRPVAPAFNSAPFLNLSNGMTLPFPTESVSLSDEEKEKLTGGALMSPGAGANLLPADLFSGDDNNRREHVQPLPGLGSLPGLPGLPSQPSHPPLELYNAGPASPASVSSRSPSAFASPQASQQNLHIGSPEGIMDADRRSIRSTRSTRAPSGGTSSRFSGMFGIRQRTKNLSEDGPPLSKANSMPRQDQQLSGLDAATRKRTSSISGTVYNGPGDAAFDGAVEAPSAAVGPGRRAFALFSKDKSGGWPSSFTSFGRRPTSPRPGSTHSNELPRPSFDSSRWGVDAWPSGEASSGARNSPLAFGPGWTLPSTSQPRLYGSRHPSRRPSVQYGASGPPEDIMEDDDSDALDADETPNLAPIGTKPPPGSKKGVDSSAKLNPNARDFKSSFSFLKFGKTSKDGESSSTNGGTAVAAPSTAPEEEESPPQSRKSRDARSMTTTESSILESGRTSADLARTPSYSNNSIEQSASGGSPSLAGSSKETFMQKISRKSSSGKFALPYLKREKSRLEPLTPSATSAPVNEGRDEEEGEDLEKSVSSLGGGGGGKGSTRSWSSVLKRGKARKGEAETPSAGGEGEGSSEEEEG